MLVTIALTRPPFIQKSLTLINNNKLISRPKYHAPARPQTSNAHFILAPGTLPPSISAKPTSTDAPLDRPPHTPVPVRVSPASCVCAKSVLIRLFHLRNSQTPTVAAYNNAAAYDAWAKRLGVSGKYSPLFTVQEMQRLVRAQCACSANSSSTLCQFSVKGCTAKSQLETCFDKYGGFGDECPTYVNYCKSITG